MKAYDDNFKNANATILDDKGNLTDNKVKDGILSLETDDEDDTNNPSGPGTNPGGPGTNPGDTTTNPDHTTNPDEPVAKEEVQLQAKFAKPVDDEQVTVVFNPSTTDLGTDIENPKFEVAITKATAVIPGDDGSETTVSLDFNEDKTAADPYTFVAQPEGEAEGQKETGAANDATDEGTTGDAITDDGAGEDTGAEAPGASAPSVAAWTSGTPEKVYVEGTVTVSGDNVETTTFPFSIGEGTLTEEFANIPLEDATNEPGGDEPGTDNPTEDSITLTKENTSVVLTKTEVAGGDDTTGDDTTGDNTDADNGGESTEAEETTKVITAVNIQVYYNVPEDGGEDNIQAPDDPETKVSGEIIEASASTTIAGPVSVTGVQLRADKNSEWKDATLNTQNLDGLTLSNINTTTGEATLNVNMIGAAGLSSAITALGLTGLEAPEGPVDINNVGAIPNTTITADLLQVHYVMKDGNPTPISIDLKENGDWTTISNPNLTEISIAENKDGDLVATVADEAIPANEIPMGLTFPTTGVGSVATVEDETITLTNKNTRVLYTGTITNGAADGSYTVEVNKGTDSTEDWVKLFDNTNTDITVTFNTKGTVATIDFDEAANIPDGYTLPAGTDGTITNFVISDVDAIGEITLTSPKMKVYYEGTGSDVKYVKVEVNNATSGEAAQADWVTLVEGEKEVNALFMFSNLSEKAGEVTVTLKGTLPSPYTFGDDINSLNEVEAISQNPSEEVKPYVVTLSEDTGTLVDGKCAFPEITVTVEGEDTPVDSSEYTPVWKDADGNEVTEATAAGTYTVTVTVGDVEAGTATFTVTAEDDNNPGGDETKYTYSIKSVTVKKADGTTEEITDAATNLVLVGEPAGEGDALTVTIKYAENASEDFKKQYVIDGTELADVPATVAADDSGADAGAGDEATTQSVMVELAQSQLPGDNISVLDTVDAAAGYAYDTQAPSNDPMMVYVYKESIMNRLYNPNSGEHFYTKDVNEKNTLVKLGWQYEGVGWVAPKASAGTTPVYRLYNANAGDHHYTKDAHEKDTLVTIGWTFEGIGWYSAADPVAYDVATNETGNRTIEVFREYNPNAKEAGAHNYTISENENVTLVSIGWIDEGIAWNALK